MRTIRGLKDALDFAAGHRTSPNDIPEEMAEAVIRRSQEIWGQPLTVQESVSRVIEEVRTGGDKAVRDLTLRIDGVTLAELEVPESALASALESISGDLRAALELSADRVSDFAKASLPITWHDSKTGLGEMIVPLERAGLYVPGGAASYPSVVIMMGVIARTAGVKEIIMCTPAMDGPRPNDAVLAAARIAGIDRVFPIGGAQAIAAMAHGTESVPRVDKICGPGSIFVTLAKQQLFGQVGIDGIYGPTETVVVADDEANPRLCAADLLAQAEHDIIASPVLITTSEAVLRQVGDEVARQIEKLDRRTIAQTSLDGQGAMILVESVDEALEVANLIAPEHLCLMVREPSRWLGHVRNAGAVFVGEHSAEVMGDYVAGPSNALPTHSSARFASYLGVDQFVKRVPVMALDEATVRRLAPTAAVIARAEGFTGHAAAADLRSGKE
jgi:histidinol dehydrogenase